MFLSSNRNTSQRVPNFLVIGPQKSGTTWIHRYLESRGDIALPRGIKETFFFDRRYERGVRWYTRHFHGNDTVRAVAEVAPSYFHVEQTAERVLRELGVIPLVCTLRHPAQRTFSLYTHMKRYGVTRLEFRDALDQHPALLDSSRYATHLKRWMALFGRENVQVLFLESLADDPNAYAHKLCEHLQLPFVEVDAKLHQRVNEAAVPNNVRVAKVAKFASDRIRSLGFYGMVEWAKRRGLKEVFFGRPGDIPIPKMSDADCSYVLTQLADEIDQLEEILSVDLSHWKAASHASRTA